MGFYSHKNETKMLRFVVVFVIFSTNRADTQKSEGK